ncbi:5'-nucleotidase [Lingula anatina]|uniref:5'-nucleotidase n=1 Tax=Lingula anatina TaxID=7574 RepID=A0A1S3K8V6_LINAN|nr:5'-nucleotidase [Lingula anatina]|eukprot:XP_013419065.1 5'-nucleotidase [Lingula anatina]
MRALVVFNILCLALSQGFDLTILHTNDVHAHIEQFDKYGGRCSEDEAAVGQCFGGVARRTTKINEIRNSERNVILLDAGDQWQGTLWFSIYHGLAATHFMNRLGYDAMVLGNHEFDNGVSGVQSLIGNASFPVVAANIDASKVPELQGLIKKSHVLSVSGERIGIVGFAHSKTPSLSYPGDLIFTDEVEAVQAEVDKLTSQGINKIIGLGHAGFIVNQKVAELVTGLDIVVGGHSHKFLYSGPPPSRETPVGDYPMIITQPSGSEVLFVTAYHYAKYLGHLHVTFDPAGIITSWNGNPILLDNSIPEDNAMLIELEPWKKKVAEFGAEKIGSSLVALDTEGCISRECSLGNFVADALVHAFLQPSQDKTRWTNVSIGFWNGGGIRSSFDIGDILVSDVLSIFPFGNGVDIVQINGSALWAIMEHSVFNMESGRGRFLQISGLRVVYDVSKPVGSRVVSLDVRCADCVVPEFKPLVETQLYNVATSTFLLGGGDGYEVLKNNILFRYGIDVLDADIMMAYIRKYSPLIHGLEGRIKFVTDSEPTECKRKIKDWKTRVVDFFKIFW